MLNRRILRIKAMQALYAYDLTINSLKEIFADKVAALHQYDPAYHDVGQKPEFEKKQRLARQQFLDHVQNGIATHGSDNPEDNATNEYLVALKTQVENEKKSALSRMSGEIKNVYKMYLKLMLIPGEIAFIERQEKEKKEKKARRVQDGSYYNFSSSPVVDAIATFKPLQELSTKEKVNWNGELEVLRGWYKSSWRKNDDILEYQSQASPSETQHFEALKVLMKQLVFKTEEVDEYMSNTDLYWSENKAILKSMIAKTIQSYEPELDPPLELKALSLNEKDDFEYFDRLFVQTIAKDVELEEIIGKKTRNWDMSRVAALDKIILKMALTEMFSFPSIPVKVTINEFIEISKKYSTPKSKQFVNGILDVLANELTSEGLIKKSGRGLIDNK